MCVCVYIMQTCMYAFLEDPPVHTSPSQSVFYFMSVHSKVKLDQHISLSCVCVCVHAYVWVCRRTGCVCPCLLRSTKNNYTKTASLLFLVYSGFFKIFIVSA